MIKNKIFWIIWIIWVILIIISNVPAINNVLQSTEMWKLADRLLLWFVVPISILAVVMTLTKKKEKDN